MTESPALTNDPAQTRQATALSEEIQRFAREHLTSAMTPARVVIVDELPRLPNGKTDRSRLGAACRDSLRRQPADSLHENRGHRTNGSPAEASACALWADLLGREVVDPNADFFALGGTSLIAVRMAARWAADGGAPFDLSRFLERPTVREMVRLIGDDYAPGYTWLTDPERLTELAVLPADIRPVSAQEGRTSGSSELQRTNVLLTGIAGSLEPYLIRALLGRPDTAVWVLVASADRYDAMRRLRERMASVGFGLSEDVSHLIAVPGDMSQPYLGIEPDTYRTLAREIDLVIHPGDCFDLRSPFEHLMQRNGLSTLEVLRFAASDGAKPVHFLSPLSVATARTSLDPTQDDLLAAEEVVGSLRQSKWVAERYIRQAAVRGIPTSTHRFGQVVASTGQTVQLCDEFMAALIKTCISLRMAPEVDLSFPVTPATFLARDLVDSVLERRRDGRAVSTVAGEPVSWREIVSNIRASGRALKVVPYTKWRQSLLDAVERAETHALTPFLPLIGTDGFSPALGYRTSWDGLRPAAGWADRGLDRASGRDLLRTYPSRFDAIATTVADITIREHTVEVPLDYAQPEGATICVYAQEVVSVEHEHDDLPWMLFLQGGPGAPCPTPTGARGWLSAALAGHRVLLLDQRGGGRSTPITAESLEGRSALEAAAYIKHFRADSIVADAEVLRKKIAGGCAWALLGQSYGGSIALAYLSAAPEGVASVFISGGLPGLGVSADDVYEHTYRELLKRNVEYYAEFPDDVRKIRQLADYLDANDVRLPDGDRLTKHRLQLLGRDLGMSGGLERVHRLFEQAWDGDAISEVFLRAVVAETGYAHRQLYALQEFTYAGQGMSTNWAAHRALARFPEFVAEEGPLLLIGEMMFPWMFREIDQLKPFREVADLLAEATDFPDLYNLARLAANSVPVIAVVYSNDLYTPVELQLRTAAAVGNTRLLQTDEFHHNGLMRSAPLLKRMLKMAQTEEA